MIQGKVHVSSWMTNELLDNFTDFMIQGKVHVS